MATGLVSFMATKGPPESPCKEKEFLDNKHSLKLKEMLSNVLYAT